MNTRTYEAFLPHHTASKHRVMAITRDIGQHTQLEAIATVGDALTARGLADALNSRLLDRRNHTARLDTALTGLPDSVRAAVTQLPIDPKHAYIGRTALAAHIYTNPIDGLLLFPTTTCTPGQCPTCTDCANDCRDCKNCADYLCDHCLPPDLTPRSAYAPHHGRLTPGRHLLRRHPHDPHRTPPTPPSPHGIARPGRRVPPVHGPLLRRPHPRPRRRPTAPNSMTSPNNSPSTS